MPVSAPSSVDQLGDPDEAPAIPLALLLRAFWRARATILATIALFAILGLVYLAVVPRRYTVEAVIGPVQEDGSASSKSVLSAYAGAFLGGAVDSDSNFVKYRQILVSTRLAGDLERNHGVAEKLLDGWDPKTHSWRKPGGIVTTLKDGLKAFLGLPGWSPPGAPQLADQLGQIVSVDHIGGTDPLDLKTQLFKVSVKLKDKDYAIKLLNWILAGSDQIVRTDQLANTTNRTRYLKDLLDRTAQVNLTPSLQELLVDEERTQMMLEADKYYSVDLIDPPHVDVANYSPQPVLVLFAACLLGFAASSVSIFVLFRKRFATAKSEDELFAAPFFDPIRYSLTKVQSITSVQRSPKGQY